MEPSNLDDLSAKIRTLPASDQDYLASLLLMERLKRNKLVMPELHQRIDNADPENWKLWQEKAESQ